MRQALIDSLPPFRRTDARFLTLGCAARIEELDDAVLVRTDDNPGYQTANALWFQEPPKPADATRWPGLFKKGFAGSRATHCALGWDGPGAPDAVLELFARDGFKYERTVCLALERGGGVPDKGAGGVEVVRARHDAEWKQITVIQEEAAQRWYPRTSVFSEKLIRACRRVADAGQGDWYLARIDGKPAGKLGLHHDGAEGRFHNIDTVPGLRRRGAATALIAAALTRAFFDLRLARVFIAADPDGDAIRIYRRFGFAPVHESHDLLRKG